jgi:aminopeptidase N
MPLATALLQILIVTTITSASPLLDKAITPDIRANEIDYHLPTNVKPIHYKITLSPLIEATDPKTFDGEVIIRVKVVEETRSITLHYNDLTIGNLNVTRVSTETDIPVNYEYDNTTHFCVIKIDKDEGDNVEDTFKANEEYVITIQYVGNHRDDMYGFYRSSYKDENGTTV